MKITKRYHNQLKTKTINLVENELINQKLKAEGFKYLISLITAIQEDAEFIPIGHEIAKQILKAIESQMPDEIICESTELECLMELLVAPIEQMVLFDFKAENKKTTSPQYFFLNRFWKKLLMSQQLDESYIERIQLILKAGLNINIKDRYKKSLYKNSIVKEYLFCPYFITTFVLRWLVLKAEATEQDFIKYEKATSSVSRDKMISFVFYYILFKLVSDTYEYQDDDGYIRNFSESRVFNIVQKYILDFNINDIEQDEKIKISNSFMKTVESILNVVDGENSQEKNYFDIVDTDDTEAISKVDSNALWKIKGEVINKILMRG